MDSIILQTGDTTVTDGDVIGRLGFAASSETGTNARLVVAKIEAVAEESFDASNNATEMVFSLAADGAAASKMILTSEGNLNIGGELQTTNIGYTDGDNSMTIADGGKVTFAAGFAVGSDAAGDILYYNGTSYVRLGIGTDGQVLTVNDAANAPQWENAAGGGGGEVNEFSFKTISVAGQSDVVADTTTDTLTLTAGSNVTITTNASTDTITIAATDTNTQLSTEEVQDIAGPLVATGGTKTLITVTYDDANGNMDFVVDNDLANYDNTTSGFLTAHPNISAASSSDNSGRTYIQDIILDSNGHVTGITTATETVTDTNTTYSAGTNISLAGTTFNVDNAFLVNNADDTTTGTITMANLIIGNAGNIGSASDTDAISIASDGEVTLSQRTTFSKAVKTPLEVNSDGTTITFDLNEANTHTVTLGGNRSLVVSNEHFGQKFIINLVQDGTGSRTVNWWGTIQWAGGSAPTLTTTGGKADSFGFINVGTFTYYGFVIGQNI